jgi:hypothetical protein
VLRSGFQDTPAIILEICAREGGLNQIVIARFDEDLSWINDIPIHFSALVINKGSPIESSEIRSRADLILDCANSGRESTSYLDMINFLINNSAADGHTVFTQGDPFAHSPHFLQALCRCHEWRVRQSLSSIFSRERRIPPAALLERRAGRTALERTLVLRPETFSLTSWAPLHFCDPGAFQIGSIYRRVHNLRMGVNIASHFLSIAGLEQAAVSSDSAEFGTFSYGAIFGISNALLSNFPTTNIARLRELVEQEPIHGYIMERLWLHLFGEPFLRCQPSA